VRGSGSIPASSPCTQLTPASLTAAGAPTRGVRSWTDLSLDRRSSGDCRVTFDHPPINTISATTVAEVAELVDLIEQDVDLEIGVVVFDSANADFYFPTTTARTITAGPRHCQQDPRGRPAWTDVLGRLALAPVVSIASIRGRACCAGTEFVLACDLRFASRENTLLGQFEVGTGMFSQRGALARLSPLAAPAEPSRSSSLGMISTRPEQRSTGMSTGSSPTTSSTARSIGSPRGLRG
jgi:enoyl-CoA hydratase/carnithine racemase